MTQSRAIRSVAIALGLAFGAVAAAAPYVPASDSDVLEQLPWNGSSNSDRAARAMRSLLARDPRSLDIAVPLAQVYVDRARSESDPRQLGHAQATLAPWWDAPDPPPQVLLLRATIRQSSHQFDAARADLERLTTQDPSNAQAWLTLATVQQVSGDLDGADRSCERVMSVAAAPIGAICKASLDGVSGRAARAYDTLDALLASPAASADARRVRTWAMTLQAELAERLGRSADAERGYRASLAVDPADAYTIAAYADFLLDADRPRDVIALIAADTPVDGLLLRRAQADRMLASADAPTTAAALADRYAALRARGDRVHLREEARFRLAIQDAPDAALDLALQDWAVQKEPLDARIALESALAARKPHAVDDVVRWIERTHLEGARLSALVAQVRAP